MEMVLKCHLLEYYSNGTNISEKRFRPLFGMGRMCARYLVCYCYCVLLSVSKGVLQ